MREDEEEAEETEEEEEEEEENVAKTVLQPTTLVAKRR